MSESGFEIARAFVRVSPDLDGFQEELEAKVEQATAGVEGKVKIGADTSELDSKTDEAKGKVEEFDGKKATARLGVDSGELDEETEAALAKLRDPETQAEAKLGADDTDLDEKTDSAKAKVKSVGSTTGTAKLDATNTAAKAKVDELSLELARLKLQAATGIKLPMDATQAEIKIAAITAEIEALKKEINSSNSLSLSGLGSSLGGLSMPGGMMGGLAAGLASLMPGIGGATTGLGLLGGTGFMAFDTVTKALSAAHQASTNVGMTSQQAAAQQFSNTVAIQQAQVAIGQAQQQAAMTTRDAAASQVQALEQVTQAAQGVQQADYNLTEANYNYSQALVQARENIVNLNDALADQKLNVQAAQLAVAQAEYQQKLVNQDAYSTDLDRQQAALAVAQAKQQVQDATDQESQAQVAANLANKQGVQGSQTVIQAKQAQTAAQYQQTDAVKAQAEAQQNLTNTELNNATQVKLANQAVTEAQLNLTNTLKEQQLEWASEQSTANQAANQFSKYMSMLSPAGQAFVNAVLSLKGPFKQMEDIAQSTVMPGMVTFLKGITSLLPEVSRGVGLMGTAIGQAFGAFGKQMQTPAFAKVLDGLITNGMRFVNIVLPAFAKLIQMFAIVGSQKGAVDGLAGILSGIANALTNMLRGMSPFVGSLSKIFTILGQALSDLGGPLGEVIGALAAELAPALQALLPGFNALVTALGSGLAAAMTGTAPLLTVLATAVSTVVEAIVPLLPVTGHLIGLFATEMAPVLASALIPAIRNLSQALEEGLATQLILLIPAVTNMLPPLAQLLTATTPLIDVVTKLTAVFLGWGATVAVQVAGQIAEGGEQIAGAINSVVRTWDTGTAQIERLAMWIWHDILDPMWQGITSGASQAVGLLAKAWSGIEGAFKIPVNWVIQYVYDDGIAKLWNDVVGAVGLGSIKLPVIHTLAGGGVLPGYAPGHDTVPAMLSPGEGVLTPGATQAIGGKPTIDALNAQHKPSSSSSSSGGGGAGHSVAKELVRRMVERPAEHAATAGKFSLGGIVGSITGTVSGLLHGGADVGKAVAALMTGNTTAFVNAITPMIGGPAAGSFGQLIAALPRTLIGDAAKAVMGMLGGGGSSGSSAIGSLPQNYRQIASYLASHGFSRFASAGVAGNVFAESGGDPEILQIGGGGGGGLIQWTPWQSYGPLITGNASQDLMTQLAAILTFGGGPASVNRATSPSDAAMLYQDLYEKPANLTASLPTRMASANAVYKAMGWGSYDQGGWLPPGITAVANRTGQPEAVLNQQQWHDTADLTAAVQQLVAHLSGASGGSAGGVTVNQIWNGPQMPSQETLAEMDRHLALILG